MPDRDLMEKVLAEDFTLVTNNSVDFRGGGPGGIGGHHSKAEIHCGLVCLNAEGGLDLDRSARCSQRRWTSSSSKRSIS